VVGLYLRASGYGPGGGGFESLRAHRHSQIASDGAAGVEFGHSVAISGSTAVWVPRST